MLLEMFEDENPSRFVDILIRNFEEKSALDIAIEAEAAKNVDLMLNKLCMLPNISFSRQIYKKFPALFDMGLKSFEAYLETCLFQTK
jgi:hypothetical protein